jgi:hypothetical protein
MNDTSLYGGRTINCEECGVLVSNAASRRKYCEECSAIVIRRRSDKGGHKPRNCAACGLCFAPSSSAQKYCSLACRHDDENRRRREKTVDRGGNAHGEAFACADCGTKLIRRSGMAKRCIDCREAYKAIAFRKWAGENKESIRERKARYRKDPRYRLDNRMGCAIWQCLRDEKAGWRWETLVGYTLDELMAHLESQFVDGMSWYNMDEWHIDHRVPKSLFAYETPDCPDFKRAWALTNLQPLWKLDNLKKGAKLLYLV